MRERTSSEDGLHAISKVFCIFNLIVQVSATIDCVVDWMVIAALCKSCIAICLCHANKTPNLEWQTV